MKKILIFYSKTGGGHFRAAEAIAEEFKSHPHEFDIRLVDALSLHSFQPDRVFMTFSTKLLPLFNILYRLTNNPTGTKLLRMIVRNYWGKSLANAISDFQPDLIISTHTAPTPQTIPLSLSCPFITICTDLGKPHLIWYDPTVTRCFVATEDIAQHFKRNVTGDRENLIVAGYPLKQAFSSTEFSSKLTKNILLLGGGSGSGNLEEQIAILQKALPNNTFSVICGMNTALKEKLEKKNYPNVRPLGFVNNLAEYITACDIVVTKAGPASIIEASALKKPIILTSWIGPQEKENIAYVRENKIGVYCPNYLQLPEAVRDVYNKYSNFTSHDGHIKNGTKNIVQYLLDNYL